MDVRGWQTRPAWKEHESFNEISVPPKTANINPQKTDLVNFSCKKKGDNKATHKGPVDTRSTELETLVYSSEEIHDAKCTANKRPERNASRNSFWVKAFNSFLCVNKAEGAKKRLANVRRTAAMTRDGASRCAIFINNEAVETAKTAMKITKGK